MGSLFTRLKKYTGNLGGRYVSMVIQETATESPAIVRVLFPAIKFDDKRHLLVREFAFETSKGKRRADLAVIERIGGGPLALLEVKDEDERTPRCHDQLEAYIAYARVRGIPFGYLTKREPPEKDRGLIAKYGGHAYAITFGQLFHLLSRPEKSDPGVGSLRRYLKEHGMVFDKIDEKSLLLLLIKGLSLPHNHGLGKKRNNRDSMAGVPDAFSAVLGNTTVMADSLYSKYGKGFFTQVPTIHFDFDPLIDWQQRAHKVFKHQAALKSKEPGGAKAGDEESTWPEPGARNYAASEFKVDGGSFRAFGTQKFKIETKNQYMSLYMGLRFDVDLTEVDSKKVLYYVWASVDLGADTELGFEMVRYRPNLTEEETTRRLEACVRSAVSQAVAAFKAKTKVNHLAPTVRKQFEAQIKVLAKRLG
jgi:hypothetical protein